MSNTEIVVVGAGVAGLSAALAVAGTGHDVTLVTKAELVESNTYHAQGGIAAAIFSDDDPKLHAADTMAAWTSSPVRVRSASASSPRPASTSTATRMDTCCAAWKRLIRAPAWCMPGETPPAKCLNWTSPPWCARTRASTSSRTPSSKISSCGAATSPASTC